MAEHDARLLHAAAHESFAGVFATTAGLFRRNAGPLMMVALISLMAQGSGVVLIRKLLGTTTALGSWGWSAGEVVGAHGDLHLHITAGLLLGLVVSLVVGGWSTATSVKLLVLHVRERRRTTLNDLTAGYRYMGWVVATSAVTNAIYLGVEIVSINVLYGPGLVPTLAVFAFLGTIWVFVAQEIVDGGRNGLQAFVESPRLVVQMGFWRTLGTLALGVLCLTGVTIALELLFMILPTGPRTVVLEAVRILITPVALSFVSAMYFFAKNEREAVTRAARGGAGAAGGGAGTAAESTGPESAG